MGNIRSPDPQFKKTYGFFYLLLGPTKSMVTIEVSELDINLKGPLKYYITNLD